MGLVSPRFVSCTGSGSGAGVPADLRTNVLLIGVVNGINTVFTTPDFYVHDGVTDEAVYLRGKRVLEGAGNDYVASESGGSGTGYDTLTFTVAPKATDNMLTDYYIDTP